MPSNRLRLFGLLLFIATIFPYKSSAQITTADSLALVDIYTATDGVNWGGNNNWLQGPVSGWTGVTVLNNRVTNINLLGFALNGVLPTTIENLSALEEFVVGGAQGAQRQLSGTIPAELGNLANLKTLLLGGHALSGTIPQELGRLGNLEILQLQINALQGNIPDSLGNLVNLRELLLGDNQLTGQLPASLGNLTNLETLSITGSAAGNQFEGIIPTEWGNLTSLEFLNLANIGRGINGEIPTQFGNLTNLVDLRITGTSLEGSLPEELGLLRQLTTIRLGNNTLTGTIPETLCQLPMLVDLHLQINALEGGVSACFTSILPLEELLLQSNQLTTLPDLSGMPNLQVLNVSENKLTFVSLEPNVSIPFFTYTDQARFGSSYDANVAIGGTLSLFGGVDIVTESMRFQWLSQRSGEIPGANDPLLDLRNVNEENIYTLRVSSTVATEATLENEPISVFLSAANETDSLLVVQIANELNPNPSPANWLDPTAPLASWEGIDILGTRIRGLSLSDFGLTGTFPNGLCDLNGLVILEAANNSINGTILDYASCMSDNLNKLDLANNPLNRSIEGISFRTNSQLQELNLKNTGISGNLAPSLGSLQFLTVADLSDNVLTSIPLFDNGRMQQLHVGNNALTFDHIVPNATLASSLETFTYIPQADIAGLNDTCQFELVKDSLFSPLPTAPNGSSQAYKLQWYFNGNEAIGSVNEKYVFTLPEITAETDCEEFFPIHLEISHDDAPGLTISTLPAAAQIAHYPDQVSWTPDITFEDYKKSSSYRLIARPGDAETLVESVLTGMPGAKNDWRLFHDTGSLGSGGLEEYTTEKADNPNFKFTAGNGFWLLSKNPLNLNQSVPTVTLAPDRGVFRITLHPRWNVISNPFEVDVLWRDVQNVNTDAAPDDLFMWTGKGYVLADTFKSASTGVAYYTFNALESDYTLNIPYTRDNINVPRAVNKQAAETFRLIASTNESEHASIRIGLDEQAMEGPDIYDIPLPTGGVFQGMLALESERDGAAYTLIREFRPKGEFAIFDLSLHAEAGQPVTLHIADNTLHEGHRILLVDKSTGTQTELTSGDPVNVVPAAAVHKYALWVGNETQLADESIDLTPESTVLLTSYPNPFSTFTQFPYAITDTEPVKLEVFDMLGRRVVVLVDQVQPAGRYESTWTGLDAEGHPVKAGVYFYRLSTSTASITNTVVKIR